MLRVVVVLCFGCEMFLLCSALYVKCNIATEHHTDALHGLPYLCFILHHPGRCSAATRPRAGVAALGAYVNKGFRAQVFRQQRFKVGTRVVNRKSS